MKKLFLIFNVMLIFLITTIGRVKAYEEPVGYFFGKEYPIYYQDPDVMPMYDVDGFTVSNYYLSNNQWISFNQSTTLPGTSSRRFRFAIKLPDTIGKYENFTVNLSCTFYGTISLSNSNNIISGSNGFSSTTASSVSNSITETATQNYTMSSSSDLVADDIVNYVQVFFVGTPLSTDFAMVCTSVYVTGVSTDGLISSIATVLSELVPYIMNIDEHIASILTFMQPILNAINSGTSSIVSAINSMSGSVVLAINSMSNAIQSDLNTINSSINSMNSNLGTKIDSMKTTLNSAIVTMMNTLNNSLNDLLGENQDTTNATNENDSTTTDFENISGQYDDIEHSAVEDFENNLANVDTDTDLLNVADFKSTSNFIATNLTNIYNSHDYIGNMIIFSLVIGFSLTLIGIKVRR